jgi:hypothetical protein
LGRLENVTHLDGGSIRAACPACRAAGADHSSRNASELGKLRAPWNYSRGATHGRASKA